MLLQRAKWQGVNQGRSSSLMHLLPPSFPSPLSFPLFFFFTFSLSLQKMFQTSKKAIKKRCPAAAVTFCLCLPFSFLSFSFFLFFPLFFFSFSFFLLGKKWKEGTRRYGSEEIVWRELRRQGDPVVQEDRWHYLSSFLVFFLSLFLFFPFFFLPPLPFLEK